MLNLKNTSFEELAGQVKASGCQIIAYGAGVIGQTVLPYFVHKYELDNQLFCFADSEPRKQGTCIKITEEKSVPVYSLEESLSRCSRFVLLVTNSRLEPVISFLDQVEKLEDQETYLLPVMLVTHRKAQDRIGAVRRSEVPLIPKKIHYCWFSGNPMPESLVRCVESWEKYCPGYEIIRWDESNYDLSWNPYMKQAYECGKWGFIPDVARLDLLYRYGGIYLDTDVELIKSLDNLLYVPAFSGVEQWGIVNCGGCSGAVQGNAMIGELLQFRCNEKFLMPDGSMNLTTCGYYETFPFLRRGMRPDCTTQEIGGMVVYSPEFFHPGDYMSGRLHLTENTYSIHHFSGSWLDQESKLKMKSASSYYDGVLDRMQWQEKTDNNE
ncbi:MAG: hypothetical protein LIP16_16280 [Clostridium sp.]|nr:hypothetical protein [Clostridium sp.]